MDIKFTKTCKIKDLIPNFAKVNFVKKMEYKS